MMRPSLVVLGFAVLAAAVPSLARAQAAAAPSPSPVALPTIPPQVDPLTRTIINAALGAYQRQQQRSAGQATGTVSYFKRFDLQLRTGTNDYRTIKLHQGTEIDPRGVTLAPGMLVDVSGQPQSDGSIAADKIVVRQ